MGAVWLSLGGGPRPGSRRSVWVFLATDRFAAKTPSHERWIVLDFLGFSRSNRDFSIDYGPLSGEKSIARFSRGVRGVERERAVDAMRKRRIVHGASLP